MRGCFCLDDHPRMAWIYRYTGRLLGSPGSSRTSFGIR